jgi:hypothetical protein
VSLFHFASIESNKKRQIEIDLLNNIIGYSYQLTLDFKDSQQIFANT